MDCGLGKTAVTLSAFYWLWRRIMARGMLVVAPLRVVHMVWEQESRLWSHLNHLSFARIHGTPAQRLRALETPSDIHLINYENLPWLCENFNLWPDTWDILTWDELHKMKGGHNAKRFTAIKYKLDFFDWRWGLTGTPIPKGYGDLWSQFYCLDMGKRLKKQVGEFRRRWFSNEAPPNAKFTDWQVRPDARRIISKRIRDITYRMSLKDANIELQDPIHQKIEIQFPPKLRKAYDQIEKDMFVEIEEAMEGGIEVENEATLTSRCHQFTQGAMWETIPVKDAAGKPVLTRGGQPKTKKIWHKIHELKLNALDDILGELADRPVLILYPFAHDRERLKLKYPKILDISDVETENLDEVQQQWNAGNILRLCGHPRSIGTGLNLQHGSYHIIFLGEVWALDDYIQALSRIWRQGQKEQVIIMHLLVPNTVDIVAYKRCKRKDKTQTSLLDDLNKYRLKKAC